MLRGREEHRTAVEQAIHVRVRQTASQQWFEECNAESPPAGPSPLKEIHITLAEESQRVRVSVERIESLLQPTEGRQCTECTGARHAASGQFERVSQAATISGHTASFITIERAPTGGNRGSRRGRRGGGRRRVALRRATAEQFLSVIIINGLERRRTVAAVTLIPAQISITL